MKVLHIAAECFPAAKAGGLGDVVGALPKYLNRIGVQTGVIMPKYGRNWIWQQETAVLYQGSVRMGHHRVRFAIEQEVNDILGFSLFFVRIPDYFDRPGIYINDHTGYGYEDEFERNVAFQQAVTQWMMSWDELPQVVHCHDHHTALVPFFMKYCPEYERLANTPTVLTIHNGVYQGAYGWGKLHYLPYFYESAKMLLDWNGVINTLACGIKCAWRVTTVSPNYLVELSVRSNGLERLIQAEWSKCLGILNGIDSETWDPATDPRIDTRYQAPDVHTFKQANKALLCKIFDLDPALPLVAFIGRLVNEKGADLLPDVITSTIYHNYNTSFLVLGTGDKRLEEVFSHMASHFHGRFSCSLQYNEDLAHQVYAGSDFILMPSRVEPCGLNQMYAMRYGTIPIVRAIGGLKDTVWDHGDWEGRGFRFQQFSVEDCLNAISRALTVYYQREEFDRLVRHDMALDFSWESSAYQYKDLYDQFY